MGFVVHAIFAGPGHPASIKIVVDQIKVTCRLVGQKSPVTIQCDIEAFLKRPFEVSLWKAASYAISTRLSFLTIRALSALDSRRLSIFLSTASPEVILPMGSLSEQQR